MDSCFNIKWEGNFVRTQIVINPTYESLRSYVEKVPEKFDLLGNVIEAKRNVLRKDCVDGLALVVKSFRRIYLTNKIRYSFFYPSKAERAFDHAIILRHNGFNSPTPIAYIEVKSFGLISQSYFIAEYSDFEPLQTIIDWDNVDGQLCEALVNYTYQLHQNNIYPIDYTLGNILYKKIDGKYQFSLVDTNRMNFGPVSVEAGIRNFVRLGLPVETLTWLAKEYARLRHSDEIRSLERLFHYKRSEVEGRRMKQHLKKMISSMKSLM
jgi:hypothetical protein